MSGRRRFESPDAWIHTFNENGVRCRELAIKGPVRLHVDQGACRLNSGDILTVLIVEDGEDYYESNFAAKHQPACYFYRDNWLVLAIRVPTDVLRTIQQSFQARESAVLE